MNCHAGKAETIAVILDFDRLGSQGQKMVRIVLLAPVFEELAEEKGTRVLPIVWLN